MDPTGFFTNGYVLMNNPSMFKAVEEVLDDVVWVEDPNGMKVPQKNKKLKNALSYTHKLLAETFLDPVFPIYDYGYGDIWNGVDKGATQWHSDLNEKPNAMFLLYFNDMNEETGGAFGYRNAISKHETGFFYPKKYDLVFGSQQEIWEHKATKINSNVDRITANFGFVIEGI